MERHHAIAKNTEFFEKALSGLAARHFFTEAVQCAAPNPPLSLAGLTCLICGIEGALRFSLNAQKSDGPLNATCDLDGGPNFNRTLLLSAAEQGFNIEVFAFPEEKGRMRDIVSNPEEQPGLVKWRNEFAHGRAYRAAEKIGGYIYSDSIMMGPAFRDMLNISYKFASEIARFMEIESDMLSPQNPLDF